MYGMIKSSDRLQGYVVQHREYSQYFVVTANGK